MTGTITIQKRVPGENPYAGLAIGDAYTILRAEPIRCGDGAPVKAGDMVQLVHSTADGGRFFEVVAIHAGSIYETRYIGSFCEVFPDAPDHSGPYRRLVEERRARQGG